MKKFLVLTGLAVSFTPLAMIPVQAQTGHHGATHAKKSAAATMYQCQKCHMKVSEATAKKDHFVDPMDGGKLVPMKAAPAKGGGTAMPGMKM